nr:MAG TPA: hypothetical protein [Bacteriophage sp.]
MRSYPDSTQQACNLTSGRFNRLNLGILVDCLLIVCLKKCFFRCRFVYIGEKGTHE